MVTGDSQEAIRRINAVRRRAVTAAQRPPATGRCSICSAPLQVVTSYSALIPPTIVIDGLSSTLYACPKDRLLWIHEVGGIADVDTWLGPVPAEVGELEGLTGPPPSRNVGGASPL